MAFLKNKARHLRVVGLLLLGVLFVNRSNAAQPIRASESELKAAHMYFFTQFTRWPTNAFADTNSPIVIGILGEDPFGEDLEKIVAVKKTRSRPLKLVRAESGAPPPECHILYISESEKDRVRELLDAVKGKPVLTVADLEPFCRLGGCIRFGRRERNVELFFNPQAARAQGLRLSPELLAIGKIRQTARNVEQK